MDQEKVAEKVLDRFAKKGEVPEAFKKQWKNKDKDGDGKENEPKPDFLKEKEAAMSERVEQSFMAGCEKLPAGGMRDNCEKKKGEKKDDGDKKDGDKEDKKPDFLKDKKSSDAPEGVVVAQTNDGAIEVFDAPTPKAATAMMEALKEKGGYQRIASGPNVDERSVNELYEDFEQRWAADDDDQDEEADDDSDEE